MITPGYEKYSKYINDQKRLTVFYKRLEDGPIDEIDAAIWSGDMFHNYANIAAFREIMARWERGLKSCEDILFEDNHE